MNRTLYAPFLVLALAALAAFVAAPGTGAAPLAALAAVLYVVAWFGVQSARQRRRAEALRIEEARP